MKVLQLCLRIPYPANDGGNIAMLGMADALSSQGVEVKMLALNTRKHWVKAENLPDKLKSLYKIESVPIDTSVKVTDAFLNLFSSESYNIKRFYSRAFEEKLCDVLNQQSFDVILLESLYMTPYINAVRKYSKAKIVLRSHNVEHMIWRRLAANEKNAIRKIYLNLLAKRMEKYETEILSSIDAVLPISDEDNLFFASKFQRLPIQTAPLGISLERYPDQIDESAPLCLFHIGSMDWRPNYEGVNWFLSEMWSVILDTFPSLNLFLAGRNFPAEMMERKVAGVHFAGEVKAAHEFMNGKQIMVVPLKSGGGMRVKIIEGMALGKTIISTTIGAEGVDYTDKKNILIADTPGEFLSAIEKCLNDKKFCFGIGSEARKLVQDKYSNDVIGKKILSFLESLKKTS